MYIVKYYANDDLENVDIDADCMESFDAVFVEFRKDGCPVAYINKHRIISVIKKDRQTAMDAGLSVKQVPMCQSEFDSQAIHHIFK